MSQIKSFVRRSGRITPSQQYALDNLWQVYGVNLDDNIIDFSNIFATPQLVILEIGFGNGDSLLQMAEVNPQLNYLAIEVYEAGIGRLMANANKRGVENLRIIKADAKSVLIDNIAADSLAGLQLFFPDPWRKKKHHKRRLVQVEFLDLVAQKMQNNAYLHIATDWQNYAEHIKLCIKKQNKFINQDNNNIYKTKVSARVPTKFEQKGLKLGHNVCDFVLVKK